MNCLAALFDHPPWKLVEFKQLGRGGWGAVGFIHIYRIRYPRTVSRFSLSWTPFVSFEMVAFINDQCRTYIKVP